VKREIINLRFLIPRSYTLCPVLIVAKKNAKNGKNNLNKKNKERMSIINNNRKNYLNRPEEKWRARDIININNIIKGIIIPRPPHPHMARLPLVVAVGANNKNHQTLIITLLWKSRLIFRPKN
jgi:hypothetical protein